jgi:tRNA(fMet)-specific endonuclease VapC
MACLDTTVVLDLLGRGGQRKRRDAQAKLRQLEHDRPHSITRFTLAELLVGLELASDPAGERAELMSLVAPLRLLEFDDRSMRIYARVYAHLRSVNRLAGVMDMLIASVTVSNGHRLVTRNAKHYEHVPGLRVDSY